jgi:hypothetical protein
VLLSALDNGHDDVDGKRHPEDDHHHIDGPFHLVVFLAGGEAEKQGHRRGNDGGIEEPELKSRQFGAPELCFAEPLNDVEESGEDNADPPSVDACVGVDRAQAPKGQVGREIEPGFHHLEGDDHPDQDSDQSPENAPVDEASHNGVIVFCFFHVSSFRYNVVKISPCS